VLSQASLSSHPTATSRAARRHASRRVVLLASSALVSVALTVSAHANDATWLAAQPADGDAGNFNNASHWDNGVPLIGNATFNTSNIQSINFTTPTTLGGITVNTNAGNYTFDTNGNSVSFSGVGISVGSGADVLFIVDGAGNQLEFDGNSTAGGAAITNLNGGVINFTTNSTAGQATITNIGTGVINFFDQTTAGTSTITNHGTLTFANSSSADSASITSDGKIFIQDNASGGTARVMLVQSVPPGTPQSGSLDISAINGTTTTVGSLADDGTGNVFLGFKNLAVGGNNQSTTFGGVIQDGGKNGGIQGSLTKEGTGTLTLTGINTYTGNTRIDGGALIVDGSILSNLVSVNPSGTLGGAGTVSSVSINGGTLAPGDGPGNFGTLTVQGNLSFTTGSTYLVQVSPATAALTSVTGTATLGGATVAANFAPGSYVVKQYNILHATGGVSGSFGSSVATTNLSSLFNATLSSGNNDVFLNLSANSGGSGGSTGGGGGSSTGGGGGSSTGGGGGSSTGGGGSSAASFTTFNTNQNNVGNAIVNSFNQTGSIPAAFALLSPAGLTQISGETAVGTQQATFSAMNQFMGVLLDPTVGALSGARASDAFASMARKAPAEAFESRWGVWGAGFGGSQNTSGNAVVGSNNTASNIFGTAVGADYRFSPNTIAGFALAGGGTHFTVDNGGSGNSDLFQAGGYVRHTQGAVFLAAALAYGWQDVTTNRTVTAFGIDSLRADFKTNALSGRLEGGYKVATGIGDITPYAAGQFTTYRLPSYAEQTAFGASTFALNYAGKDVTATRTELGLRGETAVPLTDATLMLRGRLAWAHDFNTDRNIQATFQSLPGSAFVVNGATPAADTALTTLSAETLWRNGWSASITGDAQLSDSTHSYSGKGVVRYSW
jgi:uncharacterized protein with beta-barrel porin domain